MMMTTLFFPLKKTNHLSGNDDDDDEDDDDDDIVVLPSEEARPAVRRLYLNAIEMSLRCRTLNIPLYTAVQSFYSGQICFPAIFVPVRTICLLYIVWFPNPLAPASDIKTHFSWGTRLALPKFSLRRH